MPSATASTLPFSPAELSYLHTSLSSIPPIRPDSRSTTDFRLLSAETGILPATNGSAHVSFSDGSEAIVGVKLDVERTSSAGGRKIAGGEGGHGEQDAMQIDNNGSDPNQKNNTRGDPNWISLNLTIPGMRDDDSNLFFLEEMLREPLITPVISSNPSVSSSIQDQQSHLQPQSLPDKLTINTNWHWHINIDVLLISSHGLASYPLPLLSIATNLALRDTRIPKLKSEGEEDPIADDDWMASTHLYPRATPSSSQKNTSSTPAEVPPPVTLLVITVGENVIFDPSHAELKVADSIIAVGVAVIPSSQTNTSNDEEGRAASGEAKLLSIRTIDTPARDTMKGVPRSAGGENATADENSNKEAIAGVWKPRVGGVKRSVLKNVVNAVLEGGVAKDVVQGLEGFLKVESGRAG